jgi:hypothetical protein
MRSKLACLLGSAFLVVVVAPALARRIENWPYERLFKESDLVLIATAEGTTETKDRFHPREWEVDLIGQETAFKVRTALKGDLKGARKVKVLHYRFPRGVRIEDGPLLVSFRKDPLPLRGTINGTAFQTELGRPDYLLFLRARPDGRLELISGQVDPALAVRELHSPEGFLSRLGKVKEARQATP